MTEKNNQERHDRKDVAEMPNKQENKEAALQTQSTEIPQPGTVITQVTKLPTSGRLALGVVSRVTMVLDRGTGQNVPHKEMYDIITDLVIDRLDSYGTIDPRSNEERELSVNMRGWYGSPRRSQRISAFTDKAEVIAKELLRGRVLADGHLLNEPLVLEVIGRVMTNPQGQSGPTGFDIKELYVRQPDGKFKTILGPAQRPGAATTGGTSDAQALDPRFSS